MNKGMPNTSKLLSKAILAYGGVTGVFGWILYQILFRVLNKGSQRGLMLADKLHVAIIVPHEGKVWDESMDEALVVVDSGKVLTQEEKDAIDKPTMDAFIKLATFKLRKL